MKMILKDLIKEKLIFDIFENNEQKDVIKTLTDSLMRGGYVKASYYNAILTREKKYPTAIKLGNGISVAIPHTEAIHVENSAIAIARIDNGVKFKLMEDPEEEVLVNLIIMIALKERDKQIEILEKLMELFQDQELMKSLVKANDKQELKKLINNYFAI